MNVKTFLNDSKIGIQNHQLLYTVSAEKVVVLYTSKDNLN